jgi:hypothetical protein
MRCNQCGGKYITKHGDLDITDAYVGPFTVPAVEYFECEGCGDLAYSPETILEIEKARKVGLEEMLQSFPLRDFVTATRAGVMLGISRQALHKHRRIRRGFIFKTQFADRTLYLNKSVLLFKDTGDGRFPLVEPEKEIADTPSQTATGIFVGYIKTGICEVPNMPLGVFNQTWSERKNTYVH